MQKVGLTNDMRRIKARCKIRLFCRLQAADDKTFPNKVIPITPQIVRTDATASDYSSGVVSKVLLHCNFNPRPGVAFLKVTRAFYWCWNKDKRLHLGHTQAALFTWISVAKRDFTAFLTSVGALHLEKDVNWATEVLITDRSGKAENCHCSFNPRRGTCFIRLHKSC